MKRMFLFTCFTAFIITIYAQSDTKTEIFRTPVYLQNPATDGMTVMWLTNVPSHSWVEYAKQWQTIR